MYSGGKDWTLAGEGGWVRGKASNGSNIMFGLGLEKVEPQRKQDGRQSFPGTIHSSMDQQHRTTFYALKDACGSYKPAILMESAGFWSIFQRTYSGGRTGPLALPGGKGIKAVILCFGRGGRKGKASEEASRHEGFPWYDP